MQHKAHNPEDICPVDLYVKSRVLRDAIKLANGAKEFSSLSQIYPCENEELTEIVIDLQNLFYKIAKIRQKDKISS